MAIDIGAAAIDRPSSITAGTTRVLVTNPANDDGTIDTVEVWFGFTGQNVEVATFFVVSGNNLSTRDSETLGTVTSGSKQTFSGLSMSVATGDYIGSYFTNGNLEKNSSTSGQSYWYLSGDQIPCTDATFAYVTTGGDMSLYGTGTEGGGATEKTGSDTGTGADTKASGNPLAAVNGSETGSGADSLPAREIALPDSGSGADALVSLQTPAAKTASDAGSGVEAIAIPGAVLTSIESGAGVEAFIARLLAAAETGSGAEASIIGGGGLLKNLFAGELGEGADALTAKIETPTKGGGMRLWT